MTTLTVIENEYATIQFHMDKRIVHHTILKYVYGDNLRTPMDEGIKLLTEYGALKWLSDFHQQSAIIKEDMEWIKEDWLPRAILTKWKNWAVVLPAKTVGQLSINRLATAFTERGITVETFTDPRAAFEWISS